LWLGRTEDLCYPPSAMKTAVRNRLIIGAAIVLAGAFLAYQMFFSMTPPRHADHDHAIATLDAGGFLWLETPNGKRRNMVGEPGKVLVLHWFDPTATSSSEESRAAAFVDSFAGDPMAEALFVAQAPSWDGIDGWAEATGVPMSLVYLDEDGRTGELFGVRRLPETLIYDPTGLLAYQAKGPAVWTTSNLGAQIQKAKAGVEEIH
jgi:hypothetical protein